ncbi:hypothetical protein AMECASPLE_012910 [Ameca splendens]|uniref:Uncharacterized protein n=1 Tax=Ameca splendens TaxID=208324 RepID=A0ABV0ZLL5_9TELE
MLDYVSKSLQSGCDWQVLRRSCCSSASNQPGLKRSGDPEGVVSSLSHKAWSLKISFYQASENPPPACPPSHGSSFSPWGPLNGVKHKVRRTRKYFSLLLHPPVNLNQHGQDLFLPDLAKGLFA